MYVITNFFVVPKGAKITRKRSQFLATKHQAIIISGEIRDTLIESHGKPLTGLVPVSTFNVETLTAIRDEALGANNFRVYRAMKAIIDMNFLQQE